MRILKRQMSSLLQADELGWARFVRESVRASYPMSPIFELGEEAQLVRAADLCDRARANDLRTDAELLAYVYLMHEFAPDFDQHPRIRAILDAADKPVAERWERLFDRSDEALDQAYREIERDRERLGRTFDIARCETIEEAFPATHRDPRFVRCFGEIKARNEAARARFGARLDERPPRPPQPEEGSMHLGEEGG